MKFSFFMIKWLQHCVISCFINNAAEEPAAFILYRKDGAEFSSKMLAIMCENPRCLKPEGQS